MKNTKSNKRKSILVELDPKELVIHIVHIPLIAKAIIYVVHQTHLESKFGEKEQNFFKASNGFVLMSQECISVSSTSKRFYVLGSRDFLCYKINGFQPHQTLDLNKPENIVYISQLEKAVKEYNKYFSNNAKHTISPVVFEQVLS